MSHEIFISYRRKDTGGYAGRLYDYLTEKFGRGEVLFDVEVEGTAEHLHDWVARVVPDAAVELVLIGEEWDIDRSGRRRLHEPDDVVRLEIELALRYEIPIIPVLVDGASFPNPADLPESINELARFKGYDVNNSYWEAKVAILVEAISSATNTQVPILKRGAAIWNAWRARNPGVIPHLAFGNFTGKDLDSADLSGANLRSATISGATLRKATLTSANLSQARLDDANLEAALLANSNLSGANLTRAVLRNADLEGADLSDANLNEADLTGARITNCWVYGVSVWNAQLEQVHQSDLLLSRNGTEKQGAITVDSIEMAVVVNLLASGGGMRVREFIDALTSKIVLILGRFTGDRKAVSSAIQEELRRRNFVPIVFDFERLRHRDFTETINTLAGMCLFIIADITNPRSTPLELQATIPNYMVPFVPIIEEGEQPFGMFKDLQGKFDWVLDPLMYDSTLDLISGFEEAVINPALKKYNEIVAKRAREIKIRHLSDHL
jgi:uncharacterized protein YjbI with pentapeptide repeats